MFGIPLTVVKYRTYILAISALISGLFLDLIPLTINAYTVVDMWLFPVLLCSVVVFLWDVPLWLRTLLLFGAFLLGYSVGEITVVLRNGTRVLNDLKPGLILLLFRFGMGFCALSVVHLLLKAMKKQNVSNA